MAGRTQRDRDPRTHVLMLLLDTPTPAHPTFASSNVQEAASRGTIKQQGAPRERRRQPLVTAQAHLHTVRLLVVASACPISCPLDLHHLRCSPPSTLPSAALGPCTLHISKTGNRMRTSASIRY